MDELDSSPNKTLEHLGFLMSCSAMLEASKCTLSNDIPSTAKIAFCFKVW